MGQRSRAVMLSPGAVPDFVVLLLGELLRTVAFPLRNRQFRDEFVLLTQGARSVRR